MFSVVENPQNHQRLLALKQTLQTAEKLVICFHRLQFGEFADAGGGGVEVVNLGVWRGKQERRVRRHNDLAVVATRHIYQIVRQFHLIVRRKAVFWLVEQVEAGAAKQLRHIDKTVFAVGHSALFFAEFFAEVARYAHLAHHHKILELVNVFAGFKVEPLAQNVVDAPVEVGVICLFCELATFQDGLVAAHAVLEHRLENVVAGNHARNPRNVVDACRVANGAGIFGGEISVGLEVAHIHVIVHEFARIVCAAAVDAQFLGDDVEGGGFAAAVAAAEYGYRFKVHSEQSHVGQDPERIWIDVVCAAGRAAIITVQETLLALLRRECEIVQVKH